MLHRSLQPLKNHLKPAYTTKQLIKMSSSDSQQQSQPSMLAGHAKVNWRPQSHRGDIKSQIQTNTDHSQFAQGAISSALGYETGQATKEAGIKEMREAKVHTSQLLGGEQDMKR